MTRSMLKLMSVSVLLVVGAVAVLSGFTYARRYWPVTATKPPVSGRSTLGVHSLVGQEDGRAEAVAQTRPLTTESRGSSFIAFSAVYVSNAAGPVDNMGNTWQPFGEPVIYAGYDGAFDVKAYLVLNGQGGSNRAYRVLTHNHCR